MKSESDLFTDIIKYTAHRFEMQELVAIKSRTRSLWSKGCVMVLIENWESSRGVNSYWVLVEIGEDNQIV